MVLHCKMRQVGKQTWVRAMRQQDKDLTLETVGGDVGVDGGGVKEDLMDNSTVQQRQSFHLKMVPGLSQKVSAQNTNTLH